jgi:hypothetical protein
VFQAVAVEEIRGEGVGVAICERDYDLIIYEFAMRDESVHASRMQTSAQLSAVFAVEEIFHGLAAGLVGFSLGFALVGG